MKTNTTRHIITIGFILAFLFVPYFVGMGEVAVFHPDRTEYFVVFDYWAFGLVSVIFAIAFCAGLIIAGKVIYEVIYRAVSDIHKPTEEKDDDDDYGYME